MKTIIIIISIIIVACLCGLIVTGLKIGWGPFKGLYNWDKQTDKIVEKYDYSLKNEIIFYGASNFRLWHEMENDLKEFKVQNHGFGGSTDKLLLKYADKLLYPYEPNIIFIQTGSNDYVELSGSDQEKLEKCMSFKKQMFDEFHKQLPNTKIVVMSGLLLPKRDQYKDLTININKMLKQYCDEKDYMYFADANDMTYKDGKYKEELFVEDGIHLNHDGQLIWCNEYIKPMIIQLIEKYNLNLYR